VKNVRDGLRVEWMKKVRDEGFRSQKNRPPPLNVDKGRVVGSISNANVERIEVGYLRNGGFRTQKQAAATKRCQGKAVRSISDVNGERIGWVG
jgi:hypothetical protein